MANFHFVEDYKRHVDELIARHPLDEAMSLAVGGGYEPIGALIAERLVAFGMQNGHKIVDLGCGSGRVASALAKRVDIQYLGTDVVPALLDYAKIKCPDHYQFVDHPHLSIPSSDASVDFVLAFSLFTHLLHEETYIYMEEAHRVLRSPNGKLVLSFLEFADERLWPVFDKTVAHRKRKVDTHLNTFIERSALAIWAERIGFSDVEFYSGNDPQRGVGQAVAIMKKGSEQVGA